MAMVALKTKKNIYENLPTQILFLNSKANPINESK
jgi:hypothetical protein